MKMSSQDKIDEMYGKLNTISKDAKTLVDELNAELVEAENKGQNTDCIDDNIDWVLDVRSALGRVL